VDVATEMTEFTRKQRHGSGGHGHAGPGQLHVRNWPSPCWAGDKGRLVEYGGRVTRPAPTSLLGGCSQ
jgi:hypothetical protein